MRRIFLGVLAIASLNAFAIAQNSQSLGDIARANREKQQADHAAGITPKTITNQDLPESASSGIPAENASDPMTQVSGVQRNFRAYRGGYQGYQNGGQRYGGGSWGQRPVGQPGTGGQYAGRNTGGQYSGGQYAGDHLRGQIRAQENQISELQARINRASASMHPNGSTVQYDGPLNRYQSIQAQRIETMQQMLDQQRQKLAMMQDEARRQDMHTNAYEP